MISKEECFKKGLLKKGQPDIDNAKKSLRQAEFFLKEAEELLDKDKKEISAIVLYHAFFHCARALLFKDGTKERSHHCVARYFQKEYVDKGMIDTKYLDEFESLMQVRHSVQYSIENQGIELDLNESYNLCLDLINAIEKLLKAPQ